MKAKLIFKQLKDDLIGKDAYRGVTLTYAWLANQFGHFALGFIPSMILYQVFKLKDIYEDPMIISLFVFVFWGSFEMINFLGPLLIEKKSKNEFPFFKVKKNYTFNPRWFNLGLDTFTDLCFFCIGAFTYSLLMSYSNFNLGLLFVLLILIFQPCNYWFLSRMYQLHAKYPFQFRLSQWNRPISEDNKKKIVQYLKSSKKETKHLLIFGDHKSGKTSLAVGISNELSIKQKSCLYISAMKLFEEFYNDSKEKIHHSIWNWKDVDYLIIDDINPGHPISEELVSPEQFLSFIDTGLSINKENREVLKNKNIIWVLGNKEKNESLNKNPWIQMVEGIGVHSNNIEAINLIRSS